ncbi:MAG: S-layer homology domain-containing protein [Clostridiales bacterium]|nr:S-layer homology domain-containing protein [Clostridiales bacterium]
MKKITALFLTLVLAFSAMPVNLASADTVYSDVPSSNWAADYIQKVTSLGIMQGLGSNQFGIGRNIKRCEFTAMLVRLFKWQKVTPVKASFTDVTSSKWYYSEVETAVKFGAVKTDPKTFRPDAYITRDEMAVMLVRALGYDLLADNVKSFGFPFKDVSKNIGYITIASDFGIITGKTATSFDPNGTAKREEAAAMMIRLSDRYTSSANWTNAFYAISSFSQKDMIPSFDSVSFGWSRLEVDSSGNIALNTSSSNGNEFKIPDGFETPVILAQNNGVKTSLNVYMTAQTAVTLPNGTKTNPCSVILLNADYRKKAESQILSELTRATPETGTSLYSGVTIDFEGMKGTDLKNGLNLFLKELQPMLKNAEKTLTVMVHPKMKNGGACYDAYDYRTIGDLADKVVLMAHDYAANSMSASLMNTGFTATPVTPFEDVYYALKAVTNSASGVKDKTKLALAISIDSAGWSLKNGKVVNAAAMHPTPPDLYKRLSDSTTTISYSVRYRNPCISYYDSTDNTNNVVWYEDSRSIHDKLVLARMFGVQGISTWRLGLIPVYQNPSGRNIYYYLSDELTK